MNNYELLTDEFNTTYKRYRLYMDIRGFKKFDFMMAQVLCEKKDIILFHKRNRAERLEQVFIRMARPYKTPRERFNILFDKAVQFGKKQLKGSGKRKKMNLLGPPKKINLVGKKGRGLSIFPKKNYDFKKMDKSLLGTKRKLF